MPLNRINGFYIGNGFFQESKTMTLDERNDDVNKALECRFSQLNAAFEAHEAKLKSMMVPKYVSVVYKSYPDDDQQPAGEYEFHLGMTKMRGTWRLCHGSSYESYIGDRDEGIDWKPIVEASIEDRLRAADHIEKLREAIVKEKEKLVPDVEKAIATLAHSLEVYSKPS